MIIESVADGDLQRRMEVTCVDLLPHEVLVLDELSKFIRIPPQTIKRWRSEGYGPCAVLMKRELCYAREDVIAWLYYEARRDEQYSRDVYEPRIGTLR